MTSTLPQITSTDSNLAQDENKKYSPQHNQQLTDLVDSFFSTECVHRSIQYMLCRQDRHKHDALAETVCVIIANNVFPCITECGIAFFDQHPMLILAYRDMTPQQLQFCRSYVTTLQHLNMFNGTNQMGGGSRVTPLHQNFPNIRIDPAIVLLGARRILHTYLPAHVDSDQVMNVLLQRVINSTFISRDRLVAAERMWRAHINHTKLHQDLNQ